MVEAEKAARTGKKAKKKKGGNKKKGKKDKKGKKKKDPTADRSIESLYAELVSTGIVQQPGRAAIEDYVGGFNFLGATLDKAGLKPDPSMAQVRRVRRRGGRLLGFCASPYLEKFASAHAGVLL